MSSSWFNFVKKYIWDNESTPYHIPPQRLSREQANKEVYFYSMFEGTLVGIVLISMMAHTYLTQDTSNLLYLGYGVSLLISLFYLVRNKQIWFAIYSSSLPLIILIIFNFKGFHPENTGLDKLLLSGFLTLWLIYCYRLFNICKFYKNLKH